MRKIICIFLAVLIPILTFGVPASGKESSARLYNVYSDGMLFQQKEQATVAGTADPGSVISLELKNEAGETVKTGTSAVENDGTFAVSFAAPAGSFEEYTVEVFENGLKFRTLEHVVFGELWLATGQSNMAYKYADAKDFESPSSNATERNHWVRLLETPDVPIFQGSTGKVPATEQDDIEGAVWYDANDDRAGNFSAVGYCFAQDLINQIDVPLGVVGTALGGSWIMSWLPREAIENTPALMKTGEKWKNYIPLDKWDEENVRLWCDGSALYNTKTAPLRNFRFSGMIWYQGESETQMELENGIYTEAFDLLQEYYSNLLCPGKTLPIVFTQLASYYYISNENILDKNAEFVQIQKKSPDTRALVTQYDFPTTFNNHGNAEHPETKKPIGERMSFAAQGLVYAKREAFSAATVASYEIKDGGIYVKFNNAGDGLVIDGVNAIGFSISGKDGVYYKADAIIVDKDTVFVSNPDVKNPVSASYAYFLSNYECNLYSSENAQKTLPVCPFVLDRENVKIFCLNNVWMQCESAEEWHSLSRQTYNAFYKTWKSDNAAASISADSAYEGEAGLKVCGNGKFSVSPVLSIKPEKGSYTFSDVNTDWSKYGKVSVMIRNDGSNDVKLRSLEITDFGFIKLVPKVDGSHKNGVIIPADSQWHKIVFDLSSMYLFGINFGLKLKLFILKKVTDVKFSFKGENALFSVDDIRLVPKDKNA